MVEDVQLPTVTDLSFDYGTVRTHFTITAYQNTDVVAISNIGKIGQVIFPHPIIASALLPTHNVEFDTKLLLGPQLEDFDLLLSRFVGVLASHGRRRNFLFALGLTEFNVDHARAIVARLEEYLAASN
uniref:Proteasome assembly chaperone 3 n=1 Tax=Ascaris lumbricoides TaxID=6252 RepID=A0A0M3HV86_ASCLU